MQQRVGEGVPLGARKVFGKDAGTQQLQLSDVLEVHVELTGGAFSKDKSPVGVVFKEVVAHFLGNRVALGGNARANPNHEFSRVAQLMDHFLQQTDFDAATTGMNHADGSAILTGENDREAVCGLNHTDCIFANRIGRIGFGATGLRQFQNGVAMDLLQPGNGFSR